MARDRRGLCDLKRLLREEVDADAGTGVRRSPQYVRHRDNVLLARAIGCDVFTDYSIDLLFTLKFRENPFADMAVEDLAGMFRLNRAWWRTPGALAAFNDLTAYDRDEIIADNPSFDAAMLRINGDHAASINGQRSRLVRPGSAGAARELDLPPGFDRSVYDAGAVHEQRMYLDMVVETERAHELLRELEDAPFCVSVLAVVAGADVGAGDVDPRSFMENRRSAEQERGRKVDLTRVSGGDRGTVVSHMYKRRPRELTEVVGGENAFHLFESGKVSTDAIRVVTVFGDWPSSDRSTADEYILNAVAEALE